MRPVDVKFPISQLFAGLATRGVTGRPNGSEVEYLVWLYGDYQPYGHAGVDIACPVGTPIRAMRAGTVVYAGWGEDLPGDDSWGRSGYFRRWGMYKNFPGIVTVIKADGANEFDIYGHQSDNDAVSVGLHVGEGQVIGKSGDTKTRTEKVGPHLHVVTVADPINYGTDWPRLIFGCVDPTPLFGNAGLILQGAITNAATTQAQEDDMSADMPMTSKDGAQVTLETVLNSIDEKVNGLPKLDGDLRGAFDTVTAFQRDVRATFDVVRAQNAALIAANGQLVDLLASSKSLSVDEIKAALTAAIADGIKVTVEAKSNG